MANDPDGAQQRRRRRVRSLSIPRIMPGRNSLCRIDSALSRQARSSDLMSRKSLTAFWCDLGSRRSSVLKSRFGTEKWLFYTCGILEASTNGGQSISSLRFAVAFDRSGLQIVKCLTDLSSPLDVVVVLIGNDNNRLLGGFDGCRWCPLLDTLFRRSIHR